MLGVMQQQTLMSTYVADIDSSPWDGEVVMWEEYEAIPPDTLPWGEQQRS